jgi:2-amino-4-hydroxy-6-hydroxymethyldihydropteridine diphosphokinase
MTETGFSLGSNQGDRLSNLCAAVEALRRIPEFRLTLKSPVYDTEPVGVIPAHADKPFLNAVVIGQYGGTLATLADTLAGIERAAGRIRSGGRNLPRPLDVDVIYFGRTVCSEPLQIPHPRWASRRFVVQPLCDVRPDLVMPGERRSVREVLLSLPDVPRVVLFARTW